MTLISFTIKLAGGARAAKLWQSAGRRNRGGFLCAENPPPDRTLLAQSARPRAAAHTTVHRMRATITLKAQMSSIVRTDIAQGTASYL
jgi:hypothetical protein